MDFEECITHGPVMTPGGDLLVKTCYGTLWVISGGGAIRWSLEGERGSSGAPIAGPDGTIYHSSRNLHALDADGNLLWSFAGEPCTATFGTPVLGADGMLYVIAYEQSFGCTRLYAINTDGTVRWARNDGFRMPSELVVAADGGVIVDAGSAIRGINPDGALLWELEGVTVASYPLALRADGAIIQPILVAASQRGGIRALTKDRGPLWTFDLGGAVPMEAPIIGPDGSVYYGFSSGQIVGLGSDGQARWSYFVEGNPEFPIVAGVPALAADGTLYAPGSSSLHALNSATGALQWRFHTGKGLVRSPVIGPDGRVYVVATESTGSLYAIEGTGSPLAAGQWPMHRRTPAYDASIVAISDPPGAPGGLAASVDVHTDRVDLQWNPVPGAFYYEIARSASETLESGQTIEFRAPGLMPYKDRTSVPGETQFYFIRAVNPAGTSAWTGPVQGRRLIAAVGELSWAFPTEGAIWTSPAITSGGDIVVCSSDGYLYAVNGLGHPLWRYRYGGRNSSSPSIADDGTIYFGGEIGRDPSWPTNAVFAVTSGGALKWRHLLHGGDVSGVAIGADGTVYAAIQPDLSHGIPGSVIAFDSDGEIRWEYSDGRNFWAPPVIGSDGVVYVGNLALRPDGTELWSMDEEEAGSPIIDAQGVLYYGGGSLRSVNSDGSSFWKIDFSVQGASPGVIGHDGGIYAQGDRQVLALFADGKTNWSYNTFRFSSVGMAMDAEGTVYVGTRDGSILAVTSSGGLAWEFEAGGSIFGGPALGGASEVYFGSEDGVLYAVRSAAALASTPWPHAQHDPARTGRMRQAPPVPQAPLGIAASHLTRVTDVRVEWLSAVGASIYQVFRAGSADPAEAVLIKETLKLYFDDYTAVPGVSYTYWVRAGNGEGFSGLSASATGVRRQPQAGDPLYTWEMGGSITASPAIAEDGTVYVAVGRTSGYLDWNPPRLVAVRNNGTILWDTPLPYPFLSAPSVGPDGTIFVGTRSTLGVEVPSPLVAVRPDGSVRWQFGASASIDAPPAVDEDGSIYFGVADGRFYSLTAEGSIRWQRELGTEIASAPVIGRDGTVYVYSVDGYLHAVTREGEVIWSTFVGGFAGIPPIPAIALDGESIYASLQQHGLKRVNFDGTVRWQASGFFSGPPVITSGGIVVAGGLDAGLRALDSNGGNLWTLAGGTCWGAPAISAGGEVHGLAHAGTLFTVTLNGSNLWSRHIGAVLSGSPTIASDGTVYFGGDDGVLRSFAGHGPLPDSGWPSFQRDGRNSGRDPGTAEIPGRPGAVTATDGNHNGWVRVSWPSVPGAVFYEIRRNRVADFDGSVVVAAKVGGTTNYDDRSAERGVTYYYWVRAGNGAGLGLPEMDSGFRRRADPGEFLWEYVVIGSGGTAPALGIEGVLYAGMPNGRFYAFHQDLTVKWEFNNQQLFGTPLVAPDGGIYVWSSDDRLHAFDPSGGLRWFALIQGSAGLDPAQMGTDTIIIAGRNRTLYAIDFEGTFRWQYMTPALISSSPVIGVDGTIYFGTVDGMLNAVSAEGRLVWRIGVGGQIEAAAAIGSDGTIYFGAANRGFYAVGPDGRLKWAAQAGDSIVVSPTIAPDGTVYIGSRDRRLYAFDPGGAKRWEYVAESAVATSAAVGLDGTIYFGTQSGWIHALDASGEKLWGFNAGSSFGRAPLLAGDNGIVFPTSRRLLALAVSAETEAPGPWPQFRRDARRSAQAVTPLALGVRPFDHTLVAGESFQGWALFDLPGRELRRVELLDGNKVIGVVTNDFAVLGWPPISEGLNPLRIRAMDDQGVVHLSPPIWLAAHPPARLRLDLDGQGRPSLRLEDMNGREYSLERSLDLIHWEVLEGLVGGEAPVFWSGPETDTPSSAYYRLRLHPVDRDP